MEPGLFPIEVDSDQPAGLIDVRAKARHGVGVEAPQVIPNGVQERPDTLVFNPKRLGLHPSGHYIAAACGAAAG